MTDLDYLTFDLDPELWPLDLDPGSVQIQPQLLFQSREIWNLKIPPAALKMSLGGLFFSLDVVDGQGGQEVRSLTRLWKMFLTLGQR